MSVWTDAVAATSPYAWWKLGETAGATVAADSSGNAHPASYGSPSNITYAATSLIPGDTGTSIVLNTTAAQLSASSVSIPSVGVTYATTIKSATDQTGRLFITDTLGTYLDIGATASYAKISTSIAPSLGYDPTALFNGVAHFVLYVVRATTAELWVDGVMVGSATHAAASVTKTAFYLKQPSSAPLGAYDDTLVWTSALTSAQIGALYAGWSGVVTNDNIANAITVTLANTGDTYTSPEISDAGFTVEPSESGGNNRSGWWKYTPLTSGTVTVSTVGSYLTGNPGISPNNPADTTLHVFTGSVLGSQTQIAYDDDNGVNHGGKTWTSWVQFAATAGTTYYLRVASGGFTGALTWVMNVSGPSTQAQAAGSLSLGGAISRKTASFALAGPASAGSVQLAGTKQPRTAAFALAGVVEGSISFASTLRRKTSAFSLASPALVALGAVLRPRVASVGLSGSPAVSLAGELPRKMPVFGLYVVTPVVPAPVSTAGEASVVLAQAFGAVTMQGTQPVYTVSEAMIPRARQRVIVDGVDVTYFRGVPIPPISYTLLEPLLYGPATMDLPQISACFERAGSSTVPWLHPGAVVEIQRVGDGTQTTDWKGVVVAFDTSGRDLSVELGGEANGRAALRNRQAQIFPKVNDLGHQMADLIRDLGLPFYPPLGPVTGIETLVTGGSGHLDAIEEVVAKAWTRAGRHWTIMPDEKTGVYEAHRKDTTTIDGTVFADDAKTVAQLRRDLSEEPNRVYATGVTPAGKRVRFGVYPGLVQGRAPAFPGQMQLGDTGVSVQILVARLHSVGYLKLTEAAGGFDQDVFDAVVDLQKDAGLDNVIAGVVNLATWRALYDLDVTGLSLEYAHIEPAAQRSKVRPWHRSGSGAITKANPNYEPGHLVRDRNVDLGAGLHRSQMREFARTALHDSDDPNWVGTIKFHTGGLVRGNKAVGASLTAADVMDARELRPGMNLSLPLFSGGIVVHVSAVEVGPDGSVSATVDTRARDAMEVWEVIARNVESRRDPSRRENRRRRSSTIEKDSIGEWDEIGGLLGVDVDLEAGWNVFPVVAAMEGTISRIRLKVQHDEDGREFAVAVFGRTVSADLLNNMVPHPLSKGADKIWEKRRDDFDDMWMLYSAGTREQPCGYQPGKKHFKTSSHQTLNPLYNPEAKPSTNGDQFISVDNPAYAPKADENDIGPDDDSEIKTLNPNYDPNYDPADHPNYTDELITATVETSWGKVTGLHKDDAGFAYRSEDRTVLHVAVWVGSSGAKVLSGRLLWPQLEAGV